MAAAKLEFLLPTAMDPEHSMELRAGKAVAAGALLAGPLSKRSEWLHSWNRRFCVLSTEELTWCREGSHEQHVRGSSPISGGSADSPRAVRIHSNMRLVAKEGVLLIQPGKDAAGSLWFSAASEAELRVRLSP